MFSFFYTGPFSLLLPITFFLGSTWHPWYFIARPGSIDSSNWASSSLSLSLVDIFCFSFECVLDSWTLIILWVGWPARAVYSVSISFSFLIGVNNDVVMNSYTRSFEVLAVWSVGYAPCILKMNECDWKWSSSFISISSPYVFLFCIGFIDGFWIFYAATRGGYSSLFVLFCYVSFGILLWTVGTDFFFYIYSDGQTCIAFVSGWTGFDVYPKLRFDLRITLLPLLKTDKDAS